MSVLPRAGAEIDWDEVHCVQTSCNLDQLVTEPEVRFDADVLPLPDVLPVPARLPAGRLPHDDGRGRIGHDASVGAPWPLVDPLHDAADGQMERGFFVAAARTFEALERSILASSRDSEVVATARLNLARARVHAGHYDAAGELAEGELEALGPAHAGDTRANPGLTHALETLTLVALRTGRDHDARQLATRVQKLRAPVQDSALIGMVLAELDTRGGRYLSAEERYRRACRLLGEDRFPGKPRPFEPEPVNLRTLGCRLALAVVRHRLGDLETAVETYRSARLLLEADSGREPLHLGLLYNNLADVHLARGELSPALELATTGVEFVEDRLGADHRLLGSLFLTLAQIHLARGDAGRALEDAGRALEVIETALGREHPVWALARIERGRTHLALGSLDAAADDFIQALALADASGAIEVRWQGHDALAALLQRRQRRPGAIFFARQAVTLIQEMRRDLNALSPELEAGFLRNKLDAYRRLADLLVDEGRIAEAQAVLGMLKDEELAAYTRSEGRSAATPAPDGIEGEWRERYARIEADVIARGQALRALKDIQLQRDLDEDERARRETLSADLRVAHKSYQAFVDQVRTYVKAASPERAAEVGARQLTSLRSWQNTLNDLGEGVVALHYLVTPHRLRIIVTTPDTLVVRDTDVTDRYLHRLIAAHRAAVQDPGRDPRKPARRLYDALLAPVADDLVQAAADTLLLSLDGAVRYVPFAALWDGERWLAEGYRLTLLAEAARDKLKDAPARSWRVGGLGTSRATPGFPALPAVRDELDGIVLTGRGDPRGIFQGVVHLDDDFDVERFRQVLDARYPVVHVASHFAFRPGTRRDSFLVLGDGGRLSLEQVEEEDFSFHHVDLLTLSACDTALGAPGADGREVEGLAAIFQNLGTPSVLATLWPVADESTSLFMETLYRQMYELKGRKAEALRAAQLAFLKGEVTRAEPAAGGPRGVDLLSDEEPDARRSDGSLAHPFYWAPFLLMGNFQ